ncbi:MAG: alpha-galactosidase, partial [Candidatus Hydrogenedentes bacterium]|nr:alpha-galactosidase [Candidatus Hydrogenedentota bacterium]
SSDLSTELCLLCETPPVNPTPGTTAPIAAPPACTLDIDGTDVPVTLSGSNGAFSATGVPVQEEWTWFTAPVPVGTHRITFRLTASTTPCRVGAYLRGAVASAPSEPPFDNGPSFPLYQPDRRTWSRVLVPLKEPGAAAPVRTVPRPVVQIDGVYLDTLDWIEATAGWGQATRRRSVMDLPMTVAGRRFHRGIGTHAPSRIVYDVPPGYATFTATAGYDQEVRGGAVVFVVLGDDKELFRSPVMGFESEPIDISIPLNGIGKLVLVVEDGGNDYMADHADWADARFLR